MRRTGNLLMRAGRAGSRWLISPLCLFYDSSLPQAFV
jgi:hypothetical protein